MTDECCVSGVARTIRDATAIATTIRLQHEEIVRLSDALDIARGCSCWRHGEWRCHCNNDD